MLLLEQCYDCLNSYGKTPEQLENTATLFLTVLADYPYSKIEQAFIQYLKEGKSMPVPADIIQIMNRKPKMQNVITL